MCIPLLPKSNENFLVQCYNGTKHFAHIYKALIDIGKRSASSWKLLMRKEY
jgi:hypothetical protein